MTMNVDARGNFNQSVALAIDSFAVSRTYAGVTSSQTLTKYDTSLKVSPAGSGTNWASSVRGTLTSSTIDSKAVSIDTPTPFVRSGNQAYPASGQAIIIGAAGSKVQVTAINATTVKIELDADGNGTYETTVSKPWREIL